MLMVLGATTVILSPEDLSTYSCGLPRLIGENNNTYRFEMMYYVVEARIPRHEVIVKKQLPVSDLRVSFLLLRQPQRRQPVRLTEVHILLHEFPLHLLDGYPPRRGAVLGSHRRSDATGLP